MTGGQPIEYTYDADGLTTSAIVGTSGALGTITVGRSDESGRVDSLTGGAVTTTLGYETIFGDLTLLETTCTGTTPCTQAANCDTNGDCFVEDLTYDALGRIETRTDTVQSSTNPLLTYEYDTQSRLWKVTPTGGSTATYGYDASGNKNGNRTSAPGQTLTYDEQDRISTSGYLHDSDGRLTSPDNGTTTYAYDDFGSLVSATLTGNVEIQYVYDGQRRRVTRKKLVNSVVTEERRYLYAQGNRLVAMYDGSGNLLQQYVYASGRHVPDAVIAGGVLYRIGTDHLGSVRVVVKQSDGTLVQRTEFDAWGELVGTEFVGTGWERMAFGFAGGLRDVDTGLVQMGARWYSPVIGRFVTRDPSRFAGGFNLYAYAENDPVNFVDRAGESPAPVSESPLQSLPPPVDDASGDADDPIECAPATRRVNCRKLSPAQCSTACSHAGVSCPPAFVHPYKGFKGGFCQLRGCKNGSPSSTCSYKCANGDGCERINVGPFSFWLCLYEGGGGK